MCDYDLTVLDRPTLTSKRHSSRPRTRPSPTQSPSTSPRTPSQSVWSSVSPSPPTKRHSARPSKPSAPSKRTRPFTSLPLTRRMARSSTAATSPQRQRRRVLMPLLGPARLLVCSVERLVARVLLRSARVPNPRTLTRLSSLLPSTSRSLVCKSEEIGIVRMYESLA